MQDTRSVHQLAMTAAIYKAMREAESAYKREHVDASGLSAMADVIVYSKRPKGFAKYPNIVLGWFLDTKSTLDETNDVIVERLRQRFAPYKVSGSIMTTPISSGAMKKIRAELEGRRIEIDLKSNNTLSKIKLYLRSRGARISTDRRYHADISFTDAEVIVGDRVIPIQVHEAGYQRIHIGKHWLRCDVLEAMLKRIE